MEEYLRAARWVALEVTTYKTCAVKHRYYGILAEKGRLIRSRI
jgi:hypothetical protein